MNQQFLIHQPSSSSLFFCLCLLRTMSRTVLLRDPQRVGVEPSPLRARDQEQKASQPTKSFKKNKSLRANSIPCSAILVILLLLVIIVLFCWDFINVFIMRPKYSLNDIWKFAAFASLLSPLHHFPYHACPTSSLLPSYGFIPSPPCGTVIQNSS